MLLYSAYLIFIRTEDVLEQPTPIGFDISSDIKSVDLHGAIPRSDGVELRMSADGGAFVRFDGVNAEDDWSFVVDLKVPTLHYPEFTGVYLWYAKDPQPGSFKGVTPHFEGMVAGIEIVGKYIELALGASDGSLDARAHEDVLLMRDAADPVRFAKARSLKLKVISTKRNFKMEVYDGDELLYDGLRYLNPAALGDLRAGKTFALTAHYENTPAFKPILLKSAHCFKRTEGESYDPLEIRAPRPEVPPRVSEAVPHANAHVRHLLANLEHFTTYMRAAIGDPTGMSLLRGMGNFSRAVVAHDDALQAAVAEIEADTAPPHAIAAIEARVQAAAASIASLESAINRIHAAIPRIERRAKGTYKSAAISFVCVSGALAAIGAAKSALTRIMRVKKV